MENLLKMSKKELIDYKKRILIQLKENQLNNDKRYSNSSTSYGDNINDDYNGDGDEYSELNRLIMEIQKELEKKH